MATFKVLAYNFVHKEARLKLIIAIIDLSRPQKTIIIRTISAKLCLCKIEIHYRDQMIIILRFVLS